MFAICPQLKDNIEKFFTWFVDEGKATVRLKEPAVDICLSKVGIGSRSLAIHNIKRDRKI